MRHGHLHSATTPNRCKAPWPRCPPTGTTTGTPSPRSGIATMANLGRRSTALRACRPGEPSSSRAPPARHRAVDSRCLVASPAALRPPKRPWRAPSAGRARSHALCKRAKRHHRLSPVGRSPWSPSINRSKPPGHSQVADSRSKSRARPACVATQSDHDSPYNGLPSAPSEPITSTAPRLRNSNSAPPAPLPSTPGPKEPAGKPRSSGACAPA